MKIKRWLSPTLWGIVLNMTVSIPTLGKIVTVDKSISIARKYVNVNLSERHATRASHGTPPYYIYNDRHGRGFVVVAGDDDLGQVLGYSYTGTLDTLRASEELKFLLSAYRDAFHQLQRQPSTRATVTTTPPNRKEVAPLLTTAWNQDDPYSRRTGYNYTGCVATAVAQIMYYHRWPERGKGSYSYVVRSDNRTMSVDFSESVYPWDKMLPKYNTRMALANAEACNAVALLMRDVGVSVNMQYSPTSSGAQTFMAAKALKTYFNYSTSMLNKSDEGAAAFTQILRKEIENGFPVYISGSVKSGGSGHAWVVDGVDKDNLFHMNFGWGGGGDGYFSVTALNLASTGQEFGGKPLSFNKQVQIVLVHPNKPESAPIDAELADDAPNLCFNSEGNMSVVGGMPTNKRQPVTVSYHHFKNQADGTFAGDIGLGVYNEQGEQVKVVPSAWHDNGGYTAERGKYNGGVLQSGQLIDDTCTFTLNLEELADGRYYLQAVCASIKDNSTYGAWCKMKTAPRIGFQVQDNGVRLFEKPDDKAPFVLASHPYTLKPCTAGNKATLCLSIRKLTGTPFDGTVKVSLVDDDNRVVVTGQTAEVVDFEMFAETEVRVDMHLPDNLQPKEYKLKVEVIKQFDADKIATVGMVHDNEPSTLQVEAAKSSDKLFVQLLGMVQDNSGSTISPTNVDLSSNPLLKIGVVMKLAPRATYNGKLTLCLIDTKTHRRISLGSNAQKQFNLSGGGDDEIFVTGWLRNKDSLPVINNRTYRLALMGVVDGVECDLWNENCAPFEVSFTNSIYNVYPGGTTHIDAKQSSLRMMRSGNWIDVQGEDLAHVQVFALDGTLIAAADTHGQHTVRLHVSSKQVVVVRVKTLHGSTLTKKLR
ncbi:C10 family peptidase [Hoylesella buccalis]|uniref:C10 family peptidase n=1 Tax=Hoylesella buccalis TaxID=28127 RepID=UPI002889550E|nr:C10 family peptidase [Hoylesella buccalis]